MADSQQLYNNIMGVSIAMVGVILYGHLKHASGQDKPDCLDNMCPGCILSMIEPKYAEPNEETVPLDAGKGSHENA